jgi:hypothetical protein
VHTRANTAQKRSLCVFATLLYFSLCRGSAPSNHWGGGGVITSPLANGRWWSVGRRSLLGPSPFLPHRSVNAHGASYSLLDTVSSMRRHQSLALGARHIRVWATHRPWSGYGLCAMISAACTASPPRALSSPAGPPQTRACHTGMEWRSCHCSSALGTAGHTRRTTNVSQGKCQRSVLHPTRGANSV